MKRKVEDQGLSVIKTKLPGLKLMSKVNMVTPQLIRLAT